MRLAEARITIADGNAEVSDLLYDNGHLTSQGAFTGIALEFGTLPLNQMLQALRADQWLANHPAAAATLRDAIKRQMREAFYDDSLAWQAMVYGQARTAVLQAVRSLTSKP